MYLHAHFARSLLNGYAISDANISGGGIMNLIKRYSHDWHLQVFQVKLLRHVLFLWHSEWRGDISVWVKLLIEHLLLYFSEFLAALKVKQWRSVGYADSLGHVGRVIELVPLVLIDLIIILIWLILFVWIIGWILIFLYTLNRLYLNVFLNKWLLDARALHLPDWRAYYCLLIGAHFYRLEF